MALLRRLTVSEQTASHLRTELEQGLRPGVMPVVKQLAKELRVDPKTVDAALRQLQHEGLLKGQGQGRRWRIVPPDGQTARPMRIAILEYDPPARTEAVTVELHHLLLAAGHSAFFTEQTLVDLEMDAARVRRLVRKTKTDAWIIGAGSREVLEWFSAQPLPAFAIFGRREGLPIAATGPDICSTSVEVTRHLLKLGHRRIVILCRRDRRKPGPGKTEQAVLDELAAHGVPTSDYNLPDWEESPGGLQKLLNSLFRITPPTAMILDEAPLFAAVQQFLANRGIPVPQQVSLLCTTNDPTFAWCTPSISHIRWDTGPVIRRVVQWAANVSRGKTDLRQTLTPAEFVLGGTTGPCAGS